MGQTWFELALSWVEAHPVIAILLAFAAGLGESLFIFGLLIPGALIMFAFAALAGAGALPLGPTFAAAIAGTLFGDTLSYMLGRRYRGHVQALPGFARVPRLVARGERFLARHGGKAIVIGRLLGALRPIMPTVAGAAGLSPRRFIAMEALAVILWIPCYLMPGVVFGASLDLAARVATRLAIVLLTTTAILWATTLAARYTLAAGRLAGRHYAVRLIDWSRHNRRVGWLGPSLADPHQPELPALAVAATVLMVVSGLIYPLLWGWTPPPHPIRVDALVFYLSQSLHTPISDTLAEVLAKLGSPLIYLPFAIVTTIVLAVMGNRRTASLWTAALVFSGLATVILRWWLAIPAPVTYFSGIHSSGLLAGGGQDLVLCATVYGLAGMILAAGRPPALRSYYQSLTVAAIVLIALARLYLGLDWATDLFVALPVAFIWINLLMLCYRRQRPQPIRYMPVLAVLAGSVVLAIILALLPYTGSRRPVSALPLPSTATVADWPDPGYRRLNARISDIAGRASAPLDVQAAGSRQALIAALTQAGWRAPPPMTAGQTLRWLSPDIELDELAVLPRIHDGRQPGITLIHTAPMVAGKPQRWVLRLWPSGHTTRTDDTPLWVGMVDAQTIYQRLLLFSTATDRRHFPAALAALADSLDAAGIQYRRVDPDDGPRLLFWPASQPRPSRARGGNATVAPD